MTDRTSDDAIKEELAARYNVVQNVTQNVDQRSVAGNATTCNFESKAREEFELFQVELNRVRSRIEQVNEEINNVSQQHDRAVSSHFATLDEMLTMQDARLSNLEQCNFLSRIKSSRERHDTEKQLLTDRHEEYICEIQEQINVLQAEHAQQTERSLFIQSQACEEIRNSVIEDMNALCVQMEARKEDLCEQLRQIEINHEFERQHWQSDDTGQDKSYSLKTLQDQRNAYMSEIARINDQIFCFEGQLQTLNSRMEQELTQEHSLRYAQYESDVQRNQDQYTALKKEMQEKRKSQRQGLTQLCQVANDCKNKLRSIRELADRVLSRYSMLGLERTPIQVAIERIKNQIKKLQLEEQDLLQLWRKNRQDEDKKQNGFLICNSGGPLILHGRVVSGSR